MPAWCGGTGLSLHECQVYLCRENLLGRIFCKAAKPMLIWGAAPVCRLRPTWKACRTRATCTGSTLAGEVVTLAGTGGAVPAPRRMTRRGGAPGGGGRQLKLWLGRCWRGASLATWRRWTSRGAVEVMAARAAGGTAGGRRTRRRGPAREWGGRGADAENRARVGGTSRRAAAAGPGARGDPLRRRRNWSGGHA